MKRDCCRTKMYYGKQTIVPPLSKCCEDYGISNDNSQTVPRPLQAENYRRHDKGSMSLKQEKYSQKRAERFVFICEEIHHSVWFRKVIITGTRKGGTTYRRNTQWRSIMFENPDFVAHALKIEEESADVERSCDVRLIIFPSREETALSAPNWNHAIIILLWIQGLNHEILLRRWNLK